MEKRNVCHDEEHEGQAQVEDLHDGAVDARERSEVLLPAEDAPEKEMKDCNGKMENPAREEEGLRNSHAVDFNRLNTIAVNPVAMAT